MKSIWTLVFIVSFGLLVAGPPADADIVNIRPESFNSGALQAWLDSTPPGASGPSGIDAVNDQLENAIFQAGIDLAATSTIMLEMAAYAPDNEFGIYEYGNPGNMLKLFTGSNVVGDTAFLDLDPDNNFIVDTVIAVTGTTVYTSTFSGGTELFGFWLDSPDLGGRLFYTEDSLNPGDMAQAFVYDGTAPWGLEGDYIVAFEDLDRSVGSDNDFTDFVVVASDIDKSAVPEASTLILFGSGLSGLLFIARKKRLIKL